MIERCECGKVIYGKREASGRINLAKSGHSKRGGKKLPVRAYQCPLCNMWHLTSEPRRPKAR